MCTLFEVRYTCGYWLSLATMKIQPQNHRYSVHMYLISRLFQFHLNKIVLVIGGRFSIKILNAHLNSTSENKLTATIKFQRGWDVPDMPIGSGSHTGVWGPWGGRCCPSDNHLLFGSKLGLLSHEVAGHVHTQLLEALKMRSLQLVLFMLHFQFGF